MIDNDVCHILYMTVLFVLEKFSLILLLFYPGEEILQRDIVMKNIKLLVVIDGKYDTRRINFYSRNGDIMVISKDTEGINFYNGNGDI